MYPSIQFRRIVFIITKVDGIEITLKKKIQSHNFLPWCTHVQMEVSYEMNKMYLFGAAKDNTKSLHCREIPEPAGS